ncbi:MAG: chromo domain-containing protein [Bacteroidetes bacterium]|nr:chromo domain-containing protein [Bacteroidota bacterium]
MYTKPKTGITKSKLGSLDESVEEEEEFLVEKISDRTEIVGVTYYQVCWKGQGEHESTWEPVYQLNKCAELVSEFE